MLASQDLEKILTAIPFNRMLGLTIDSIEEHHAVMSFSMKEELIGNFIHGILHGGVISSVIDMSGGVAAMAAALKKHPDKNIEELKAILGKASTINLNVNFIRPGKGNYFVATSRVLRGGNKIYFTHTDFHNEENILIATGAGTYIIG